MSMSRTEDSWEIHIDKQFHIGVELHWWRVQVHKQTPGRLDSLVFDLGNLADTFPDPKLELTDETLEDLVSQAVEFIRKDEKTKRFTLEEVNDLELSAVEAEREQIIWLLLKETKIPVDVLESLIEKIKGEES